MNINYKEEAPGMVRIIPSMEGILTAERYIEIARSLLENGLSVEREKLKDENSVNLADNLSLYMELESKRPSEVKQVVFSMYGRDYLVNLNNIDTIISRQPADTKGVKQDAISEAMQEVYESYR